MTTTLLPTTLQALHDHLKKHYTHYETTQLEDGGHYSDYHRKIEQDDLHIECTITFDVVDNPTHLNVFVQDERIGCCLNSIPVPIRHDRRSQETRRNI